MLTLNEAPPACRIETALGHRAHVSDYILSMRLRLLAGLRLDEEDQAISTEESSQ